MHIVIDFDSILRERHSGFFTYGAGLLAGFAELDDCPRLSLFYAGKSRGHLAWLHDVPKPQGLGFCGSKFNGRTLQTVWDTLCRPSLEFWSGPFDAYHCNHHLMPPTRGKPRIMTIHDLRRYRFPEFYPGSKVVRFEQAVHAADHFIAISHATKNDLQEFFGIPDDRVDVVYHGGLRSVGQVANAASREALLQRLGVQAGRYFVAFSSYDRRKNIPTLVRAFAQALTKLDDDYKLVVVGSLPKELAEESLMSLTPQARGRIVMTGTLDECSPVLSGARALVFVSLYEGFGLPILEAMAAGTAVITSDCSSMPEVAGSAAMLVNPTDTDEIADAMVGLAGDNAYHSDLVAKGRQRVNYFSWQRTAAETLEVYRQVCGQ